jgi:hypothetical protein
VKDLDCNGEGNICQTNMNCDEVASNLKPVGFLIAGGSQAGGETIFEVSPSVYLFQAQDKC